MILASELLETLKGNFIGLSDDNIRGASIDLSLGDVAKIRKDKETIDLFELQLDCDEDRGGIYDDLYEEVDLAKGYELKPNSYLYGKTVEHVTIPNDKCGIVLPRSSFARIGLLLPMSNFANPGYGGHLPIIIFNASPVSVKIPPYIRIVQLLLCDLQGEAKEYTEHRDSKYQNDDLHNPSFSDADLKGIFERIDARRLH